MEDMKRFLSRLCAFALTLSSIGFALPAHAASISAGDLIKGPGDTVYYYGTNGKRYVFPTQKTYATWYADFSTVKTISAGDLAAITLGGNVTYRPGVRLVKVTTDPKVYAVASNGTLRWVQTEAVAATLYGANWNTKIDDVPDAFFTNYTVGAPIANASDYSPSAQTTSATDIGTDKNLSGTPTPTTPVTTTPTSTTTTTTTTASTNPLTLSVTYDPAQPGDIETLLANYQGTDTLSKLELFFGDQLITVCHVISCSGDALVPTSGTQSSYLAEARATMLNGKVVTSTQNVKIAADGSSVVSVSVGSAFIKPGQAGSVAATADLSYVPNRIDIFVDGINVVSCADGSASCNWSNIMNGADGAVRPVYAKMTDYLGRVYTSDTKTITLRTADVPLVTVSPVKTLIYGGETLEVTVTATSNVALSSIDIMKDGAIIKHCIGAAPCTATTGPWTSGSVLTFTGQATDSAGTVGSATSTDLVSVVAR